MGKEEEEKLNEEGEEFEEEDEKNEEDEEFEEEARRLEKRTWR